MWHTNSLHAFHNFEKGDNVKKYKCHFRLNDLTRDDLYRKGVTAITEQFCPIKIFYKPKKNNKNVYTTHVCLGQLILECARRP